MKYYGQSQEDRIVHNYFGHDFKGNILDIGANMGEFLSNSLALINVGYSAWCIEPSSAFTDLQELHKDNPNVHCYNYAIGDKGGEFTLLESGNHIPNGNDKCLVSTFDINETKRWPNVTFTERFVRMVTFDTFYKEAGEPKFDFVSVDCEGYDKIILEQMNLSKIGCSCLCIEYNRDAKLESEFTKYCAQFDLKLHYKNSENLIFCR